MTGVVPHWPGGVARQVAAGSLLVLALAACGGGESETAPPTATTAEPTTETSPATTTTPTTTVAPTETETETEAVPPPGPPFGTAPVSGPASGRGLALLTGVRIGHHPGFDRVVFEFRPGSRPGYLVRYVRPPIKEDPSDRPVRIAGEAFLSIRMEPASGFDLTGMAGETYSGPLRIDGDSAGTEVLEEVVRTGDFEAVLNWVAGLQEHVPFRVIALPGPPRLVVDLRTGS